MTLANNLPSICERSNVGRRDASYSYQIFFDDEHRERCEGTANIIRSHLERNQRPVDMKRGCPTFKYQDDGLVVIYILPVQPMRALLASHMGFELPMTLCPVMGAYTFLEISESGTKSWHEIISSAARFGENPQNECLLCTIPLKSKCTRNSVHFH